MTKGDKVQVSRRSHWRTDFGDAVGEVQEADAADGRCSVHFPTLQRFAQGWFQDDFEPAPDSQGRRDGGTGGR